MARLPQPGSDQGAWGDILNDFLVQSHNANGSLKDISQSNVTNLTSDLAAKANASDVTASLAAKADLSAGVVPVGQLPASLQPQALTTKITSAISGSARVAFLGDSITAFDSSAGYSYHRILTGLLNTRVDHVGAFATGGFTLTQIRETHLPQVLALNPLPTLVFICGATNDIGGGGYNESASRAVLLDMITTLKANGIQPGLWAPPPRDDSTTVNANVQRWSAWVRMLAHENGYPLIDAHAALVDEATGLYKSDMRLDNTHPSIKGHYAIAIKAASDGALQQVLPAPRMHLLQSILDSTSMFPAPARALFMAGVDGGGRPTGWSEYTAGSHTGTIVTSTAIPGNWLEISRAASAGGAGGGYQFDISTGFAPGDRIMLSFAYDMIADEMRTGFFMVPSLQMRTAGGVTRSTSKHASLGGTHSGVLSDVLVVPSDAASIRVNLGVGGTPTIDSRVRIGQVTLLNLTALGL